MVQFHIIRCASRCIRVLFRAFCSAFFDKWSILRYLFVTLQSEEYKNKMKTVINSYDEFASYLGKPLGTSEWLEVDQDRINAFADATLDHQWIHVDVERAKAESPYKSTIAHGYLTLALLPHLWDEIVEVNNLKMMVNYGMDKMRFGQPVITGSRIRMTAKLANIENLRGISKAYIDFTIEIEGQRKPALKGEAQFLYYFK